MRSQRTAVVVGGDERTELSDLTLAMKRTAEVLRRAGVRFALCGGLAQFARGGTASDHDVDFLILPEDADRTLAAMADAGHEIERPPEDWLVKAYVDGVLIDFIHRPVDRPVTTQTLADTDDLSLAAMTLPVLSGTELLVHGLLRLTATECNFTEALLLARAIREQIDFDRVREETKVSPFARAFLFLADELGIGDGP
jgi:hypothetical protein